MRTVIIVCPDVLPGIAQPTFWQPVADAFERCFKARGWHVKTTNKAIKDEPDLVAGYGWKEVMRGAHERWPDRVLHCDLGFWSRGTHLKLAFGGRWSPLVDREYDGSRLGQHKVRIQQTKAPGKRVLLCGMSAKAAGTWGLRLHEWEEQMAHRLKKAGATVIFRPKLSARGSRLMRAAATDESRSIDDALARVDGVVSHHSNAGVDALAAGLPIYVETGISRPLSVAQPEDIIGAEAPNMEARTAFLRQLAWHQWTLDELAAGLWLEPPAPLSGHPGLTEGIS